MLKRSSPPLTLPGVRVFEGTSIFEAYSKLKRSLGEDAVILSTKHIKKGGMLGIGGKKFIQITASESSYHTHQLPAPKPAAPVPSESPQTNRAQQTNTAVTSPDIMLSFQSDIREIRQMIQDMQEHGQYKVWPDLPQAFQKAYEKLQKFNIDDDIATALIHRWKGHYPNYKRGEKVDVRLLEKYIGEMIIPAGPIQLKTKGPTTVMLVGPTGVGKTTSIAKLAARYKIQQKKSIGLITIDTYRIAAVEQLRTYADLIGIPLKVIDSPDALQEALRSFSDRDLILIDSAGRSPRNTEKMNELHQYVHAAQADELHLVLSMSVGADVMADTLKRYQEFSVSKLLFTKLDEAVNYGAILGIINKTQKPIGYITTGQEVPDDIEVVTQERLARLILHLDKVGG
jgi:flagellar biosynthesis protein FlhF